MIIKPRGLNRVQQEIEFDDGRKVLRCRGPHNPVWYYDQKEGLKPVNIATLDYAGKSKVGNMINRFANVRTVGIREDLTTEKFLGIRKDDDQDGNEQLEISLLSLKINGLEGSFTPSSMTVDQPYMQGFGGFKISSTRQGTRLYVPYQNNIDTFEMKLFIHATGLTPRQHDFVNEFWFENTKGELFARFRQPDIYNYAGEARIDKAPQRIIDHTLEPAPGGWIYTKYSTKPLGALGLPVGSLIDGDIYYSITADGRIWHHSANWNTARTAATGTGIDTAATFAEVSTAFSGDYRIFRAYLFSDTSGATNPGSALWYVYQSINASAMVFSVGKSTATAPIGTDDYGSRHTTEWSHTACPISTIGYVNGSVTPADINLSGTTAWSIIEYAHDYSDVAAGASITRQATTADYTGTTRDPYLDITESTGWSGGDVGGVGNASIGSVGGVDISDIGDVGGV